MTVRVAMLGAGFIAGFRAQVYARTEGARLVSVLGQERGPTEEFATRAGIGFVATNWEELLAGPGFDAVDVCLPNHLHEAFCLRAAAAGKHILCEKPLGRTAAEAARMLAAARRSGIVHAYGENMAHAPDFREIMDILSAGTLGKPLWLRGREAHFGPHAPWFWQREAAGGGALIDMGCHLIGLFNRILGAPPAQALAFAPTLHHATDCEDNALCLLRYKGGTVGQCEASWTQRGGMAVSFEVQGADGFLTYDRSALSQPIRVFARNRTERYFSEKAEQDRGWLFPTVDEYRRYGYFDEIADFVRCVQRGERPLLDFADGLAVNRVMDACYASAASGTWQTVDA